VREVFAAARVGRLRGTDRLDLWLAEARAGDLSEFHDVARKIDDTAEIDACLTSGLNNGLVECLNTMIRLTTRRALGTATSTLSSS
jgi:transposase